MTGRKGHGAQDRRRERRRRGRERTPLPDTCWRCALRFDRETPALAGRAVCGDCAAAVERHAAELRGDQPGPPLPWADR